MELDQKIFEVVIINVPHDLYQLVLYYAGGLVMAGALSRSFDSAYRMAEQYRVPIVDHTRDEED